MSVKGPTLYDGVDTIRQIQELGILCSLLPSTGKVREVLELALALDEKPLLSRVTPVPDLHPHTVKAWIESFCPSLSTEEKELIDWQSNSENMTAAMQELRNVEQLIGMKLVAERTS